MTGIDTVDEGSVVTSAGCVARIDWCEPSAKMLGHRQAMRIVEDALGSPFTRDAWLIDRDDARWFVARGPYGATLRSDRVGSVNGHGAIESWSSVKLPGKACASVGTSRLLDLVARFREYGGLKVARLDVALDDMTRSFTPREFAERCVDGSLDDEGAKLRPAVVTRVRRDAWEWNRRLGGCWWLGSKGGRRLLRVYDKGEESKGAIDAIRVELQCRDEAGTALAVDLLRAREAGASLAEVMAQHLVGFVDIRQPTGSRTSSASWPRADWWEEFIGGVRRATIAGVDASPFESWEKGLRRQIRGFLEIQLQRRGCSLEDLPKLRDGDPGTVAAFAATLEGIRGPGRVRLSAKQRARLEEARVRDGRTPAVPSDA